MVNVKILIKKKIKKGETVSFYKIGGLNYTLLKPLFVQFSKSQINDYQVINYS